jgi:hypothetical protein
VVLAKETGSRESRKISRCNTSYAELWGVEKKVTNGMGLNRHRAAGIELKSDQHHAVEMHAPLKTHELAHGNDREMLDTSRGRT